MEMSCHKQETVQLPKNLKILRIRFVI